MGSDFRNTQKNNKPKKLASSYVKLADFVATLPDVLTTVGLLLEKNKILSQ